MHFLPPEFECNMHRTGLVNRKRIDMAWKTWKKRREQVVIMTLSVEQTSKAYPSCLATVAVNDHCLTVFC